MSSMEFLSASFSILSSWADVVVLSYILYLDGDITLLVRLLFSMKATVSPAISPLSEFYFSPISEFLAALAFGFLCIF